jgi:hypothetical protein
MVDKAEDSPSPLQSQCRPPADILEVHFRPILSTTLVFVATSLATYHDKLL